MTQALRTWADESVVAAYLERHDKNVRRREAEATLLELLPDQPATIADLGAGDGRLGALVRDARPSARRLTAIDSSPAMLRRLSARFAADETVTIVDADLGDIDLTAYGPFDVIVSGFAIHHLDDPGKQRLYGRVADALRPGGLFASLDVVTSATPALHREFLDAINRPADDPEDRLASVDDQLTWLRTAGLTDVDCLWRWRGFALLIGRRPGG